MADLTSKERRQLDELAGDLARDNPRLARALAGRWYAIRRRRLLRGPRRSRPGRARAWLATILLLTGLPLLSLGVLLPQPVLIVLGAWTMLNAPMPLIATWSRWPPAG